MIKLYFMDGIIIETKFKLRLDVLPNKQFCVEFKHFFFKYIQICVAYLAAIQHGK